MFFISYKAILNHLYTQAGSTDRFESTIIALLVQKIARVFQISWNVWRRNIQRSWEQLLTNLRLGNKCL